MIVPPAIVTCPHRIHVGSGVLIHGRAWLSVVEEHHGHRFTPLLRIGDGTVLGHDLLVACVGEITIGARVLASDRVFIGDTFHDYRDPTAPIADQPMREPRAVHIGDGAFLGVNAVILPGVDIGPRAYVGAGAVVADDVPANAVVAGNPARVVRSYDAAAGRWVAGPGTTGSAGRPR